MNSIVILDMILLSVTGCDKQLRMALTKNQFPILFTELLEQIHFLIQDDEVQKRSTV
jgi:hypothetical protein